MVNNCGRFQYVSDLDLDLSFLAVVDVDFQDRNRTNRTADFDTFESALMAVPNGTKIIKIRIYLRGLDGVK